MASLSQSRTNKIVAQLYLEKFCNTSGKLVNAVNLVKFRKAVLKQYPNCSETIDASLERLDKEIVDELCEDAGVDAGGRFLEPSVLCLRLQSMRPDLGPVQCKVWVEQIEEENISAAAQRPKSLLLNRQWDTNSQIGVNHLIETEYQRRYFLKNGKSLPLKVGNFRKALIKEHPQLSSHIDVAFERLEHRINGKGMDTETTVPPEAPATTVASSPLEEWVHKKFLSRGFDKNGKFRGWPKFTRIVVGKKPKKEEEIVSIIQRLSDPDHPLSWPNLPTTRTIANKPQTPPPALEIHMPNLSTLALESTTSVTADPVSSDESEPVNALETKKTAALTENTNTLASKSGKSLSNANGILTPLPEPSSNATVPLTPRTGNARVRPETDRITYKDTRGNKRNGHNVYPNYNHMDCLLPDDHELDDVQETSAHDVRHAPLIAEDLITHEYKDALPQYGFFGLHEKSKLFLNTNVPFSAFICGVQGSGKSHTTSCLIENALISSQILGRLEHPLSALVFSYSNMNGEGSGLNVSEAAFLASPNPSLPNHPYVEKVTVLYSESNPALARAYRRLPNVEAVPFKIKPKHLDIGTMLTLMNVDESSSPPLYLGEVTRILREMAKRGCEGVNYIEFQRKLECCDFNPTQRQMLDLRLDILESFLDLDDDIPEPQYRPGEITIMDMSCPFVDASTACVLFNIGLKRYLQSQAAGKMVVLDEAHKYMLDNPGARALNNQLLQTIRLQRHFGARVIISTQEPTLLTDLIALCSIAVIHRFSSPQWLSALKKHIPTSCLDHDKLLRDIESLRTGTGLLYSPNAILGKDETGALIKGMSKLINVSIRKRVTADGGASIMAV